MQRYLIPVFVACFCFSTVANSQTSRNGLSATEAAVASQLTERISTSEWLGPLAPVALSPFFGIACLSGVALYAGEWIPGGNALLENSALKNPTLFWTFVILSIITSLPRLSKVSKPFAQAVDQVEAYAGIITLLIIKFWAFDASDPTTEAVVYQAGVFSFTADTLLAIAATINILVVNSVKFFFEFLIWITPVPFLDACFEVANKSACAMLMGIYAYSPTLATGINLAMFVICLFIFQWTHRRVVFYRTMCLDPLLSLCFNGYGKLKLPRLVVFPQASFGDFPEKSLLHFEKDSQGGWKLIQPRLLREPVVVVYSQEQLRPTLKKGWLTNSLILVIKEENETSERHESEIVLVFSHRHTQDWTQLCELLGANTVDIEELSVSDRKAEFA